MKKTLSQDLAAARTDYLHSGSETSLPIVDAHHHFWRMDNPHPWLTELPRIPFRYGDYEVICKDTERDNFMTAQQAMEYGLIDKVIATKSK